MRILAAALLVAACSSSTVVVGDLQEVMSLKAIPNRDLDILFVIDNSPSMLDKQHSLAKNFPRMIDELSSLPDGLPNLHIGIVTSDLGTSGSRTAPVTGVGGCVGSGDAGKLVPIAAAGGQQFLSDVADGTGNRQRNYTGDLRDAFAAAALVGDQGCGFEQHLGAMRRALDNNPQNAGFLRPTANLAIVIVADEDDCSVGDSAFFGNDPALGPLLSYRCFRFGVQCEPDNPDAPGDQSNCKPRDASPYLDRVQPFADFLSALKGDARRVMVSAIVGDPAPVSVVLSTLPGSNTPTLALGHSCTYTGTDGTEQADPAVRIAAFVDAFPERSQLTSICNADLSLALHDIGSSARKLVGDPCLDTSNLVDTSSAPGVQPTCDVTDVDDSAPSSPTKLPRCSDGADPLCFDLVADPVACPASPDHMRVAIHREFPAGDGVWTHVRCERR